MSLFEGRDDKSGVSSPDTLVKGTRALAEHFGVDIRTAQRWVKDPSFPQMISGRRWDLVQVQAWLDARDGKPPASSTGAGDPRQPGLMEPKKAPEEESSAPVRGKDAEDARLKKVTADLKELEYKQRLGEMMPRQEVRMMFIARILATKQGLLTLSRKLPPQLIHCQSEREMEIIIARAMRELLEEFSRPLPGNLGEGEDPAAEPEEPDGQN